MSPNDILVLGIKQSVMAICRADGSILWTTRLEGGAGHAFITLVSDHKYVYATCNGVLHGLELQTGTVVWSNPLKGFGYGIASLYLPGQHAPLHAGAAAQLAADAAGAAAGSAATT